MAELEIVRLSLSEWEALRLCDLEGCDQAVAGRSMGVSRGTVQRLLKSGRRKLLSAILETKALVIEQEGEHEAPAAL